MEYLFISSGWINALLNEFERSHLDIDLLTSGLPGFEGGYYSDSERLELFSARLLWHRAEQYSSDPLIGARIGLSDNLRSIGVLAPLIWHSDTIAKIFENISRYQTLISENGAFKIEMTSQPGIFHCVYHETPAAIRSSFQQVLSVATALINIARKVTDNRVVVQKLYVPEFSACRELGELLCLPVEIKGPQICIELKIDLDRLNEKIMGCDQHLYGICQEYARSLLAKKDAGMEVIEGVRRFVSANGYGHADVESCASELKLHPRNLQRALRKAGTNFRSIKEEVSKEFAVILINESNDIQYIAEQLGYSELSGFYRIFKSWFGITPKKAIKDGLFGVN